MSQPTHKAGQCRQRHAGDEGMREVLARRRAGHFKILAYRRAECLAKTELSDYLRLRERLQINSNGVRKSLASKTSATDSFGSPHSWIVKVRTWARRTGCHEVCQAVRTVCPARGRGLSLNPRYNNSFPIRHAACE